MNILLTCAGRRSYLVQYFMELDNVNEVHTANNLIDSPAMLVADYNFHTGSIYSKNYVDSIISYCKKNNIKMVISLLDLGHPSFLHAINTQAAIIPNLFDPLDIFLEDICL